MCVQLAYLTAADALSLSIIPLFFPSPLPGQRVCVVFVCVVCISVTLCQLEKSAAGRAGPHCPSMPIGGQKAGDKEASGAQVCRETQTITDQSESQSETTGLAAVFPDGRIRAAPPEGHNAAAKLRYNAICAGGGAGGRGHCERSPDICAGELR